MRQLIDKEILSVNGGNHRGQPHLLPVDSTSPEDKFPENIIPVELPELPFPKVTI